VSGGFSQRNERISNSGGLIPEFHGKRIDFMRNINMIHGLCGEDGFMLGSFFRMMPAVSLMCGIAG